MTTIKEQASVFHQGKLLDERDISAGEFLDGKAFDPNKQGVFAMLPPMDHSARVFLEGVIPMHESANDFMGEGD